MFFSPKKIVCFDKDDILNILRVYRCHAWSGLLHGWTLPKVDIKRNVKTFKIII